MARSAHGSAGAASPRRRRPAALALLLGCGALAGCWLGGSPAPSGYLASQTETGSDAFGGWIRLSLESGGTVEGELLAVSADSLWVLEVDSARTIAMVDVKKGRLTGYESGARTVQLAAAMGTLSTLSNGALLVLTAPMWGIGGGIAADAQSHVSRQTLPPDDWRDLALFARFPQGLPDRLDLASLRPKLEPKKTPARRHRLRP